MLPSDSPSSASEGERRMRESVSPASGSCELPFFSNDPTDNEKDLLGNCSRNEVIRSALAEAAQESSAIPLVVLGDADIRRLDTVATALKAGQANIVGDCCNLVRLDLLSDFPAQTFLQEPAILESLINFCEENVALEKNHEVIASALQSLGEIVDALVVQIFKYLDPKFVVISGPMLDNDISKRSWSVLELVWAGIAVSGTCIRCSTQFSVLNEAVRLLRSCLILHSRFFANQEALECNRVAVLLADLLDANPPAFVFIQLLRFVEDLMRRFPDVLKTSVVLAASLQKSILHAGIWLFRGEETKFFVGQLESLRPDEKFSKLVHSVSGMCHAITSAQQIVQKETDRITKELVAQAAMSLDFIPSPAVATACVEALSDAKISDPATLLSLLAHPSAEVQLAAYETVAEVVGASVGQQQAADPFGRTSQGVRFLCDPEAIREIASHGLELPQAGGAALEALTAFLGCHRFVSPELRTSITSCVQYLAPVLFAKIIGRPRLRDVLLNLFNPSNDHIPPIMALKGNACAMFCNDEGARKVASARLLELLKKDSRSGAMWPKISETKIPSDALCIVKDPLDLHLSPPGHFYNESSLKQIVALSKGHSEPTIKYSALCQLALMLQEPHLVGAFLQSFSVQLLVDMLDEALVQSNTDVLSKCTVPIISILLRIISRQTSLIKELAEDEKLFSNLIRAMLLYSSFDEDFRMRHSALLGLLLFSDLLLTKKLSPSDECFVLPDCVVSGLWVPFQAQTYSKRSSCTPQNEWLRLKILADTFTSVDNLSLLLKGHAAIAQFSCLDQFDPSKAMPLMLSEKELHFLVQFDASGTLRRALAAVQSATSHKHVLLALPLVSSYVPCLSEPNLDKLEWRDAFDNFLKRSPTTTEDLNLLSNIAHTLARHRVSHWIRPKELCPKFEHMQEWCAPTFAPLLQSCICHMDADDLSSTMRFLCNCLIHNFPRNEGSLGAVLSCLCDLTGQQSVQLSSRLLADLMAPLVEVVHSFQQDHTFIGLHLIDLALACLLAIQNQNSQNFFHHFYVISEHCDIMNVFSRILESNKSDLKASCLSLLTGLAGCNGYKSYKLDFTCLAETATRLAIASKEPCAARIEAVTLISCLLDYENMTEETFGLMNLLEHNWFGQMARLHKCLYLHESFHVSELNLIASPCAESPTGLLNQLVVPQLLSKHFALLHNLATSPLCHQTVDEVHQHNLLQGALSVLSRCLEEETELRDGVCELVCTCARFAAICLITDKDDTHRFGAAILELQFLPAQLLRALSSPDYSAVSSSVMWLVVALLQDGRFALFEDAFLEGQLWPALHSALQDSESEAAQAALLLIRAVTIERRNGRRAPVEDRKLVEGVCSALMRQLMVEESHQQAMAALAGLVASSPVAKRRALDLGLLENLVTALRICLKGLLTTRSGPEKKRITQELVEELVDSFELLTAFVMDEPHVKNAAANSVLVEQISVFWPVCLSDGKILAAVIKFLIAFTQNCEKACRALLLRKEALSELAVQLNPSGAISLVHQLSSLADTEIRANKSSQLVLFALSILGNCCASSECRVSLVKSGVMSKIFSDSNRIEQIQPRVQVGILKLLEKLSRHSEGQNYVARIPDAVDFFCTSASSKSSVEIARVCTAIVRNLCFSPANRVLVLNSGRLLAAMSEILERGDDAHRVEAVAAAVWSLAANNHRAKQALRAAGLLEALRKAKGACAHADPVLATVESAIASL